MRKFLSASCTDNLVSLRAAYLELVYTLQAKTSRRHQSSFVNSLCDHYGHAKEGALLRVWDVTTGFLTIRASMTAAHIFSLNLGQKSMDYTFGEDAEDGLNRARNGLFLPLIEHFESYNSNSTGKTNTHAYLFFSGRCGGRKVKKCYGIPKDFDIMLRPEFYSKKKTRKRQSVPSKFREWDEY